MSAAPSVVTGNRMRGEAPMRVRIFSSPSMGTPMMAALKLLSSERIGELDEPRARRGQGEEHEEHRLAPAVVFETRAGRPRGKGEIRGDQTRALGLIEVAETTRGLSRGQRAKKVDHVPAVVLGEGGAESRHGLLHAVGKPPEHVARRVIVGMRCGQVCGPRSQAGAGGA